MGGPGDGLHRSTIDFSEPSIGIVRDWIRQIQRGIGAYVISIEVVIPIFPFVDRLLRVLGNL